jgi:hypothetical protein
LGRRTRVVWWPAIAGETIPDVRLAFDVNESLKGNVQGLIGGYKQATKIIFIVGFFYGSLAK